MTRKQLEDLGISKEQADSIMKINGEDIENAKSASETDAKNMKKELEGLKIQVSERDKQLEDLKESAGGNEELAKQIADLQKENAAAKEAHESEVNQLKVDFAVEKALAKAGARNEKAAKALLDLEDAKFDKEGNIKGLQEQIDKLAAADDTKFLFKSKQTKLKGFQPGISAQTKPGEEVDVSKMSYEEIAAYMDSNPDAQI